MSKASKGANFEREIKDMFEQAGFSVIRGAASKGEMFDHKVDLVATKATLRTDYTVFLYVIGVQCKANST